jgi:beta-glucanase (GH16 family)
MCAAATITIVLATSVRAQTVPAAQGRIWNPTYTNEFSTGASDLAGFTYDIGNGQGGWGNNELEFYTSNSTNSFVNNGALTIRAVGTQSGPNVTYTSARIRTTNLFSQTYGLFEFRAKLPAGQGLWPALWMMPKDSAYGGWPTSGEIDIFEGKGQDMGWASSALHSGPTPGQDNVQTRTFQQSGLRPAGFTTADWHTYSFQWDDGPGTAAGTMTFYIDGVAYHTRTGGWTTPAGQPGSAPFDKPFYILMNLAVGGNFVGGLHPGVGTYDMQVDYMHAYSIALRPTWKTNSSGNWTDPLKWTDSIVPNAADANVLFGNAIAQAQTVTLDVPITVGKLTFDNANRYTLGGTLPLTLNTTGAPATIDVLNGSHTIAAPVALQKNTTLTVANAAHTLTMSGGVTGAAGTTLTKAGAGTVQLKNLRGGALAVNAGTAQIIPGNGNNGASKVEALTVAPAATLDLTDSAAVIDYSSSTPLDSIRSSIANGYAGGSWTGAGLTSSLAAAVAADASNVHKTALGYAEASALGVTDFFGQDVDATAVLVRYTLVGDANLDGSVSLADFNALAANFGSANRQWFEGDFNFDGSVNLSDFNLLAVNFGLSVPASEAFSSVPEPAAISCLFVAALFATRRQSR